MNRTADHATRLAFLRTHDIDDSVADDPAFPDDATTWDEWCLHRAKAERITDPEQLQARAATIRRWPYRSNDTPKPRPAIASPPPAPREDGLKPIAPAIHSRRELDAWAAQHAPQGPQPNPGLEALAAMTEPMRLPDIAKVVEMTPRDIRREREQSAKRVAKGKPRKVGGVVVEFPAPETGQPGDRAATYHPAKVAAFLRTRPGKGRRTEPGTAPQQD
ncbi:hypothetical protein [Nocardiopsis sp. NRRL B-16309]|uniref:hypothetical protein n=1 Tax=Nocardiopsis sp. NRRL B-16309 TaxID=1519494 RepID=UPI0006AF7310|nr:hypothetical protein [Nocardiopsis sp. NRRL B-16309]KOX13701.1 hypothetical protein ADL05_18665 [Nocardiopsis sp. NRRL B-16309]